MLGVVIKQHGGVTVQQVAKEKENSGNSAGRISSMHYTHLIDVRVLKWMRESRAAPMEMILADSTVLTSWKNGIDNGCWCGSRYPSLVQHPYATTRCVLGQDPDSWGTGWRITHPCGVTSNARRPWSPGLSTCDVTASRHDTAAQTPSFTRGSQLDLDLDHAAFNAKTGKRSQAFASGGRQHPHVWPAPYFTKLSVLTHRNNNQMPPPPALSKFSPADGIDLYMAPAKMTGVKSEDAEAGHMVQLQTKRQRWIHTVEAS
ncbi:hypothetical protein G7Z17_g10483 [Cylindrodendrum hubeiense]|uniref:Uncharacterized protein n=1 Tax=Cylindrodendrum hubeiense TaxID=595255 RepID=A0A9P5H2M2_9HYPO|nr:hypothetical protein G7Z17_g10483 [Cylindrodendrum hubeiense]